MSTEKVKVAVAGGGGFIGSHLAKSLKEEGFYVRAADWKRNEFMEDSEFCDEFHLMDLRQLNNCLQLSEGCVDVYNLAADMGGMGFIKSNECVLMFNNTMISAHMLEAARRNGVKRYFYASSACVYNEDKQLESDNPGLKESDAWPAKPQDTYGLEKLYSEEMGLAYMRDFGFYFRTARFHNVYGPRGSWKGGREKAPAAFCRKAICSDKDFEMWGNGEQTRSFVYIDDVVEGIKKIMNHPTLDVPLNLGSTEMISMNDFAKMALGLAGKPQMPIRHVEGPLGVQGRNSENTLIKEKLGWEPSTKLEVGMKSTLEWVRGQIEEEKKNGKDISEYAVSKIVVQSTETLTNFTAT